MSKSRVDVTLGLMTWGKEGTSGARIHSIAECEKMLDVFLSYGHRRVDSALAYSAGTSEEYLGAIDYKSKGVLVDTKLYPSKAWGAQSKMGEGGISHSPQDLRKYLDRQLKALKTDKLDTWFLHGPDRSTPYEVTLEAVNELYKEGKFERFGISNYMSWEVAEICCICEKNGWVKPTVYQGLYAFLQRNVEPELFPCLRKFGLSFTAFNPLLGGLVFRKKDAQVESGSRFDDQQLQGKMYRARYWNDQYFDAIELIRKTADKHDLTMAEVALRWMQHHSLLTPEHKDSILIGASSTSHLEQNLKDFEKGPLPQEILDVVDEAWHNVKGIATQYFH